MAPERQETISAEEIELLQELMNIAFGKAAADLAEVMDMYVVLSVPNIRVVPAVELIQHINSEIREHPRISIVEQDFWGEFKGAAFLILPADASRGLLSLRAGEPASGPEDPGEESIDALERETLMEVGNIIIGACVGKLAELLGTVVSYTPPSVAIDNQSASSIRADVFDPEYSAVVLQTLFCFNERNVKGFVFLVSSSESVRWLRAALNRFLSQYE